MKKNKKIIISIITIISIIFISFLIIYNVKNKKKMIKENDEIEENNELVGGIENEEYYYKKQKEYENISNEYEDLVAQYAEKRFTEEEKSIIKDYQKKMTEAKDRETKINLSHEYAKVYENFKEKEFTKQELDEINKLSDKINELETIVDEYQELIAKVEEEKSKEDLQTIENGNIQSYRKDIISEKEYDGLKFCDIKLIYDATKDATKISMKIVNTTSETKGNKLATLNFTGSTDCKYPIKIEEVAVNEYIEEEVLIPFDLTNTNKLEIIDYNQNDYKE